MLYIMLINNYLLCGRRRSWICRAGPRTSRRDASRFLVLGREQWQTQSWVQTHASGSQRFQYTTWNKTKLIKTKILLTRPRYIIIYPTKTRHTDFTVSPKSNSNKRIYYCIESARTGALTQIPPTTYTIYIHR